MFIWYIASIGIILLATTLWQWRHQRKLALRARLMREAILNHDFTFRLPTSGLLYGERELQATLNDMGGEISRLLARNEIESWQRLTRVLTHEIMNSLAPIQSITQAYVTSQLVKGTPLEEGMKAIYETSHSLADFVSNYRKLTQMQPAIIKEASLHQCLAGIKTLQNGICWHISKDSDAAIDTDTGLLHQVLANIVKNACEAGARNIGIRTSEHIGNGEYIEIRISNDGKPIPADEAREIFIPFFTTKNTGSGIGLPLARQMMTATDGELRLADKAEPGYTTTFIIVARRSKH